MKPQPLPQRTPPFFAVEAWADRSPRTRYPLLFLALLLLWGLAGIDRT